MLGPGARPYRIFQSGDETARGVDSDGRAAKNKDSKGGKTGKEREQKWGRNGVVKRPSGRARGKGAGSGR
jgi:hypothetical protein